MIHSIKKVLIPKLQERKDEATETAASERKARANDAAKVAKGEMTQQEFNNIHK